MDRSHLLGDKASTTVRAMDYIVCLIAQPEREILGQELVQRIARGLGTLPRWLAEGEACEYAVTGDPAALRALVQTETADRAIDVCVLPAEGRRKLLLISDLDSTMITIESIDELADMAGAKAEVAEITGRAMRGELAFAPALEARVALLAGLPDTIFDEVYHSRLRLMPGARCLVRTMAGKGAISALVSGGFMPLAERVQRDIGFDVVQANRLEVVDGQLTGRVLPPIVGPEAKLTLLKRLCERQHIKPDQVLAVGDGANDLPMLHAAGLGVAFRAHAPVAREVSVAIEHGDLRALLFLQGIEEGEFAA
ncbi:MAG: phosphoserine phosphatase SerB [Pseudomonadota bacterium]